RPRLPLSHARSDPLAPGRDRAAPAPAARGPTRAAGIRREPVHVPCALVPRPAHPKTLKKERVMKRKVIAPLLGALALLLAIGVGTAAAASPGVQVAGQSAGSAQQATSASGATQVAPSNSNISVRVLSPGNDGAVTQTNSASSDASST